MPWYVRRYPQVWTRKACYVFPVLFFCTLLVVLAGCASSLSGTTSTSPPAVHRIQHNAPASLTYVAIGASETFGAGTDDPATESWPANLATSLGKPVHLINLGIPGSHIHDALSSELPVALDAHPDLVTIWLAVNDLADHVPLASYSHDLDLLLGRLQAAAPHARIAVANAPDLTLLPYFRSYNVATLRAQIAAYNTAIADIVQRHHVMLVDIYNSWHELADHPDYISGDGLHPDALGYTRIAQIFYDVLRKNGIS